MSGTALTLAGAVALTTVATAVATVALLRLRRADRVVRRAVHRLDPAQEGARGDDASVLLVRAVERTVQRAAERDAALRRFDRALAAIPQGVVLADTAGQVVYRNPVAEAIARGRHTDALIDVAVGEVLEDAARGLPGNRTLDLFGPPRRTLVISGVPLGARGTEATSQANGDARPSAAEAGVLVVIEDISERRRLDAVRRDFVANISHELRTPVGALGLLAETLLGEEDADVRARLAERMLAETDRVSHTIDDLLTLSRIESEELPERAPVAAGLVMAEAAERIRPAAEQRRIEVVVKEPPARLAIYGDRRQLVSALYNLLDNAVKYSDPDSEVEVSSTTDGVDVALSVRDHGIGIPSSDVSRIFERFYRVDQARSRQTGGTGLGLAIVRHVATNHGGEVLVDSRLGEGSVFTLKIPTASVGPVPVRTAEAS